MEALDNPAIKRELPEVTTVVLQAMALSTEVIPPLEILLPAAATLRMLRLVETQVTLQAVAGVMSLQEAV